jgi:hypothetical protein
MQDDSRAHGCAYLTGEGAGARRCGAPRGLDSSYCPHHHALCHLARGSRAEKMALREVRSLASMVGGRRGRAANGPSTQFLDRLEAAVRDLG